MPLERPISRCQESQDPRFRGVSDILLAQFGQQAEPTQERLEIKEDQNNPIGSLAIGITASSVTLGEVMQNQIDEPLETTSGMCRASFGIDWKERYNKDKPHRHQSKRQEILKGGWVVMNRMKWLLDKGDLLREARITKHTMYSYHEEPWDGSFSVDIYQSEKYPPPYKKDKAVVPICKIECSLRNLIRVSGLPLHKERSGRAVRLLEFDIITVPRPAGQGVDFEVVVGGRRAGMSSVGNKLLTGNDL